MDELRGKRWNMTGPATLNGQPLVDFRMPFLGYKTPTFKIPPLCSSCTETSDSLVQSCSNLTKEILDTRQQILTKGLSPWMQPIFDGDRNIVKNELLVRGIHNNGRLLSAKEITDVPTCSIAQQFINFYVEAILHSKETKTDLAINLPLFYLRGLAFERVHEVIKDLDFSKQLTIELLETDQERDFTPDVLRNLDLLRQDGVKVAIDDFLTGESNIKRAKLIKPDYVKLDGQHFKELGLCEFTDGVVPALIDLVHRIKALVVYEIIESEEEFQYLKSAGVDFYQGYHLGRPAPITP